MHELNELLTELGWSRAKLARVCEVEAHTAGRWFRGETQVPAIVLKHLRVLIILKKAGE